MAELSIAVSVFGKSIYLDVDARATVQFRNPSYCSISYNERLHQFAQSLPHDFSVPLSQIHHC